MKSSLCWYLSAAARIPSEKPLEKMERPEKSRSASGNRNVFKAETRRSHAYATSQNEGRMPRNSAKPFPTTSPHAEPTTRTEWREPCERGCTYNCRSARIRHRPSRLVCALASCAILFSRPCFGAFFRFPPLFLRICALSQRLPLFVQRPRFSLFLLRGSSSQCCNGFWCAFERRTVPACATGNRFLLLCGALFGRAPC